MKESKRGQVRKTETARMRSVRVGFQINLSLEEKIVLSEAATKSGLALAVFIRETAIERADKLLQRSSP